MLTHIPAINRRSRQVTDVSKEDANIFIALCWASVRGCHVRTSLL